MALYKKGESGNPVGRPKGSKNKLTEYRHIAAPDMPKLVKKLMKMALDGDLGAAKLVLDRMWTVSSVQVLQLEEQMDELRELLESKE